MAVGGDTGDVFAGRLASELGFHFGHTGVVGLFSGIIDGFAAELERLATGIQGVCMRGEERGLHGASVDRFADLSVYQIAAE